MKLSEKMVEALRHVEAGVRSYGPHGWRPVDFPETRLNSRTLQALQDRGLIDWHQAGLGGAAAYVTLALTPAGEAALEEIGPEKKRR